MSTPALLIRQSVSQMGPEQFAAYDAALRSVDYFQLNPEDQRNYALALSAVNERRQMEGQALNVTIREGMNSPAAQIQAVVGSVPRWAWIAAGAVGLYLVAGK